MFCRTFYFHEYNHFFYYFQFLVLLTRDCNMVLFLKFASVTCPFFIILLFYCFCILNSKAVSYANKFSRIPKTLVVALFANWIIWILQIGNFHDQIRDDWTLLRDKKECDIMEQHIHNSHIIIQLIFCKKNEYLVKSNKENVRERMYDLI